MLPMYRIWATSTSQAAWQSSTSILSLLRFKHRMKSLMRIGSLHTTGYQSQSLEQQVERTFITQKTCWIFLMVRQRSRMTFGRVVRVSWRKEQARETLVVADIPAGLRVAGGQLPGKVALPLSHRLLVPSQ